MPAVFDSNLPQRFVRFNKRPPLGCGQIRIRLNSLNDFCRRRSRLVATQQIGRDVEGFSDCTKYLFRRSAKPTFDLGKVRIRDAGHRRNLAHRQLG